jgi:hypothetical protein
MERTAFTTCPSCGCLTLTSVWTRQGGEGQPGWQDLPVPLTPVMGDVHACPSAQAQQREVA